MAWWWFTKSAYSLDFFMIFLSFVRFAFCYCFFCFFFLSLHFVSVFCYRVGRLVWLELMPIHTMDGMYLQCRRRYDAIKSMDTKCSIRCCAWLKLQASSWRWELSFGALYAWNEFLTHAIPNTRICRPDRKPPQKNHKIEGFCRLKWIAFMHALRTLRIHHFSSFYSFFILPFFHI